VCNPPKGLPPAKSLLFKAKRPVTGATSHAGYLLGRVCVSRPGASRTS